MTNSHGVLCVGYKACCSYYKLNNYVIDSWCYINWQGSLAYTLLANCARY